MAKKHGGCTKTIAEWCDVYRIKYVTFRKRVTSYGVSPEAALTKPVRQRGANT